MWISILVLTVIALVPMTAMAYLDPGTGSMLLQVFLGGLAAVGVVLKLYWHKILAALGLGTRVEAEAEDEGA